MHYVVLRDDDTNALTPVPYLERLYRPFLERGLPVNLAVIPEVSTGVKMADGSFEGFLLAKNGNVAATLPIGSHPELTKYLLANPGYKIVQHGCHHDYFEFDRSNRNEIRARLQTGARILAEAGFAKPRTFVAPYDKLSRASLREVPRSFDVLSTGWFELRRLPVSWWPHYLLKKLSRAPHWRVGNTILLTHPGCLLSCYRDLGTMLDRVKATVLGSGLTVLVTHWWEYFRDHKPNEPLIHILHQTAAFLDKTPGVKVVSFDDVATGRVPLS